MFRHAARVFRRLLPQHLRDRPFTVAEALVAGVPASSLRGGSLRRPFRGVRVPAHLPDDLVTLCRAALLVLPRGAAFSGVTAVSLCSLPLPRHLPPSLSGGLHVRVDDPGRVPQLEGVRAGEGLAAGTTWEHPAHLPVLHPLHAWVELAPDLPHVEAVALGDAVRRRWADDAALADAVLARTGRRGVRRLREVLADVRYRVDSPQETRLRLLLLAAGLPEPRCGREAIGPAGWLAQPDLSWPELRVAVEYDGVHHRTDRVQWARDLRRREVLEAAGWVVIVITAEDLQHPQRTVARVRDALVRQGAAL